MKKASDINPKSAVPKYRQIINQVIDCIEKGEYKEGSTLPSINEWCARDGLARETVVKAYKALKEEGIIESRQGKGFSIVSTNLHLENHIFILLDTFSSYKEKLYFSIKEEFGGDARIDMYFHHFNATVFETLVKQYSGKYKTYILLPFEDPRMKKILQSIPSQKLYLLDRYPKSVTDDYYGIYQDFEFDIYQALKSTNGRYNNYRKFNFIFRNTITQPPKELVTGFTSFCNDYHLSFEILYDYPDIPIKKNEAWLVIDDEDLVNIILQARNTGYELGKDLGIISYNETSLKKVASSGISVISTDFELMGRNIAKMIKEGRHEKQKNPCCFIDRGSF
jgi:DNA-binding transcriptional regulator YhcF (GntR family)